METLNAVNAVVTYVFIWAGWIGQGLYCALFLTRNWQAGRWAKSLMAGRLAFFLLLTNSFIVLNMYGLRPLDWPAWLLVFRIVTNTLMLAAIYYQLLSLLTEVREDYHESQTP